MLRRPFKRVAAAAVLVAAAMVPSLPAGAHNAGHLVRPDGTCLEVGSFRPAPLVGPDREQLDLMPETPSPPFDEYGASFAAFRGGTPLEPGPCPPP